MAKGKKTTKQQKTSPYTDDEIAKIMAENAELKAENAKLKKSKKESKRAVKLEKKLEERYGPDNVKKLTKQTVAKKTREGINKLDAKKKAKAKVEEAKNDDKYRNDRVRKTEMIGKKKSKLEKKGYATSVRLSYYPKIDDINDILPEDDTPDQIKMKTESFMVEAQRLLTPEIEKYVEKWGSVKAYSELIVNFSRLLKRNTGEIHDEKNEVPSSFKIPKLGTINDKNMTTEIKKLFNVEKIKKDIESYMNKGSDFAISAYVKFSVSIFKTNQKKKGKRHIKLNSELKNKGVCVNPNNKDEKCFMWAILAVLHYDDVTDKKNRGRVSQYKQYIDELNFQGIDFPVEIDGSDYERFEALNTDICLNVYDGGSISKYSLAIIYDSPHKERKHAVNIMLVNDDEGNYHYIAINNLKGLLSSEATSHKKRYVCKKCSWTTYSEKEIERHESVKCKPEPRVIMPEKGDTMQFKSIKNMYYNPLCIYFDLESIQQKYTNEDGVQETEHVNCASSINVVCSEEFKDHSQTFEKLILFDNSKEHMEGFFDELKLIHNNVKKMLKKTYPIDMTEEDKQNYKEATKCHICGYKFSEKYDKVRDHYHWKQVNNYRGAAHSHCNLHYNLKNLVIPVLSHGLKNYDSHFILRAVGARDDVEIKRSVPLSQIQMLSFDISFKDPDTTNKLSFRFLDSHAFLSGSLEKLALKITDDQLVHTSKYFENYFRTVLHKEFKEDDFELVRKKGTFPYEWLDSEEKLNICKIPEEKHFLSSLKGEKITEENKEKYEKILKERRDWVVNIWKTFKCETLRDVLNIYLKIDTLLLTDVFETNRKVMYSKSNLDMTKYYSLPGFALDYALRTYGRKIELMHDEDMYSKFEAALLGGYVAAIFSEAEYDESTKIIGVDMNNLYGWALSQLLPLGEYISEKDFKWEKKLKEILNLADDSKKGCFAIVDLHVPKELHDKFDMFPLAPEHKRITEELVGEYTLEKYEKDDMKFRESEKLVCTLADKKEYMCHYRNLKYYVKKGMQVTKIHEVIWFKQGKIFDKYIKTCADNRKIAKDENNEMLSDFWKLLANSVFGKTCENVRNRINLTFTENTPKHTSHFRFLESYPLYSKEKRKESIGKEEGKGLHVVIKSRKDVKLEKPIQIGAAVLQLAKLKLYEFHYDTIMENFEYAKLLYTDTDSLIYSIKANNKNDIISKISDQLDLSNYPKDNQLYKNRNKKNDGVPGIMKDISPGNEILKYIGLAPKVYTLITEKDAQMKAKGIKKDVVASTITLGDYVDVKKNGDYIVRTQASILADKFHKVKTKNTTKIALASRDDKRYHVNDNKSYSYGHYKIKQKNSKE
jgi:hypothetical protein